MVRDEYFRTHGMTLFQGRSFALTDGPLREVAPTDVGTLGFVALLLTVVALVASAVPAWRASEIDPLQALREE